MRKLIGISVALLLIIALFYFLQPSRQEQRIDSKKNEQSNEPVGGGSSSHRRQWTRANKGAVSESSPLADLPTNAVVHRAPDFNRGDAQNLRVTEEGLEMGDDPGFVPRFNPAFQRFGVFVSAEEFSAAPFDEIVPFLERTSPKETTEVTFDIRTKQQDGTWTVWQEIDVADLKSIKLEAPSTSWQYRLTLLGNDPSTGPKVHGVGIVPQKAPAPELRSDR